jgi:hypothetical protein
VLHATGADAAAVVIGFIWAIDVLRIGQCKSQTAAAFGT